MKDQYKGYAVKKMMPYDETCYIIMPFSETKNHNTEYWNDHYEKFLKPFIEEKFSELTVRRSAPLRGNILDEILVDLSQSRIVIADLTDFNPNVLWELGIRQSFRNGTITIAEKGLDLPFDLAHNHTIFYDFTHHVHSSKWKKFLDLFYSAIDDCLHNPSKIDSPVLEAIPRGTFYEIINKTNIIKKIDAIVLECDTNISVLEDALHFAETNESTENNTIFIRRLRDAAVEHLVVNQYLDENKEFYKSADSILDEISLVNDQLRNWEYNAWNTEDWVARYLPSVLQSIENFKERITESQERLLIIS